MQQTKITSICITVETLSTINTKKIQMFILILSRREAVRSFICREDSVAIRYGTNFNTIDVTATIFRPSVKPAGFMLRHMAGNLSA